MHHPSSARKREWSSATATQTTEGSSSDHSHALVEREGGEVIEKEMKRLRLAKEDDERTGMWPFVFFFWDTGWISSVLTL